jgi:D-glycero-D-manno-heptose 1,7-bisphosphate phosphatase
MNPPRRPAAFLDRDGVINEEREYVHRIEDFQLLPGVIEALQALARSGYALVVATNQGGIGLGLYGPQDVERLHVHLRSLLAAHGVTLDAIHHCPHHPRSPEPALRGPCECRKPAPGMLLRAARELELDLGRSLMVGDKPADIAAGRAAGVGHNFLVRSGHALSAEDERAADAVFDDLNACVRAWLARPAGMPAA